MSEKRTCSKATFGFIVYLFIHIERTKDFIAYNDQIQLYFFFVVLFSCKFKLCCLATFSAHLLIYSIVLGTLKLWHHGGSKWWRGLYAAPCVNSALVQEEAQHELLLLHGLYFIFSVSLFHTSQQMIAYIWQTTKGKLLLLVSHKLKQTYLLLFSVRFVKLNVDPVTCWVQW